MKTPSRTLEKVDESEGAASVDAASETTWEPLSSDGGAPGFVALLHATRRVKHPARTPERLAQAIVIVGKLQGSIKRHFAAGVTLRFSTIG